MKTLETNSTDENVISKMIQKFSTAQLCPYKDSSGKCNLTFDDAELLPHGQTLNSLLSTTGPFEARDSPETVRIGQQKRCCVPSEQR
ncbi:hypothetical protein TNCV_190481 [Trichonephila clavipes]|nr:hypothetical protein TNCV_190481 [Trichonephila clavipes]